MRTHCVCLRPQIFEGWYFWICGPRQTPIVHIIAFSSSINLKPSKMFKHSNIFFIPEKFSTQKYFITLKNFWNIEVFSNSKNWLLSGQNGSALLRQAQSESLTKIAIDHDIYIKKFSSFLDKQILDSQLNTRVKTDWTTPLQRTS